MLSSSNPIRRGLVRAAVLAMSVGTIVPSVALAAPGWDPDDIYDTNSVQDKYDSGTTLEFAKSIITAFFGIAIAVFVLKVVLTAVDRLLLGGDSNSGFRLDEIPLVGAYTDPEKGGAGDGPASPWTWQRIWAYFAVQITLCVSAIALTSLLVSIIGTVVTESGLTE